MLDTVLRGARIAGARADAPLVDIGIVGGTIAAVEPDIRSDADSIDLGGKLVSPGLVETHIHLDKSRIVDRCAPAAGRARDHMERVSAVKSGFTVEDVYARAAATLEQCILNGTTHVRTHVEVDPNVGLRSFEALEQLAADHAWAVDLELCVFAQEGWTNVPETDRNVVAALERGASVVGGAPGYDPDAAGQIRRIFELALEFDRDVDIHLDVGPSADEMDIDLVCDLTERHGYGGRVAVGHGTKYSLLPPDRLRALGERLASAGVAVTVLPATDLFVTGRHQDHAVVRGVADANALIAHGANCSLSTNNVLNPFTPVRRLLAHPHREPLRQRRATRQRGGACGVLRDAHPAFGAPAPTARTTASRWAARRTSWCGTRAPPPRRWRRSRCRSSASSAGGGPSAAPCRSSIGPDPVCVAPIW